MEATVEAKNKKLEMKEMDRAREKKEDIDFEYLDRTFLYQNRTTGAVSSSCKLSVRQLCRILCPPPSPFTADNNKTASSTSSTSIITPETNLIEYDSKSGEYSKDGWKIAKSIPVLQQACASWYYTTTTKTTPATNDDIITENKTTTNAERQTHGPVSCRQLAAFMESGIFNVDTDMIYSPIVSTAIGSDTATTTNNNTWCTIQNNPQLKIACQVFLSSENTRNQQHQHQEQPFAIESTTAMQVQQEQEDQQEKNQNQQRQQVDQVQEELEAFLASTSHLGKNLMHTNGDDNNVSNNKGNEHADDDDFDESYESDGGTTYVKDPLTGNWIHHALAIQQRQQYQNLSRKGTSDNNKNESKKNKDINNDIGNINSTNNKKRKRQKKTNFAAKNAKCWIYVSGLPIIPTDDAYEQEVFQFFSKAGIIDIHPGTQKPKVKLYRDKSDGSYKGDASICYARPESVELALMILDDSQFSFDSTNSKPNAATTKRIKVQRAKFEQHGDTYEQSRKNNISNAQRKVAKLATRQMTDWDHGEFNGRLTGGRKGLRIIVLRNMFHIPASEDKETTEKQMDLYFSKLECLIRKECENRFGRIEKITIFSSNPQGIVIVKFAQPGSASDAVKELNGEEWDFTNITHPNNNNSNQKRKIYASFWDGVEDFTVQKDEEKEQKEMEQRHEEFGNWLESQQAEQLPDEFKLQVEGEGQ